MTASCALTRLAFYKRGRAGNPKILALVFRNRASSRRLRLISMSLSFMIHIPVSFFALFGTGADRPPFRRGDKRIFPPKIGNIGMIRIRAQLH
jgi:hypothetical protein